MIQFFYFILSVWGLTHLLISSKILKEFRNWCLVKIPFVGEMLTCYQCTSFWVSMSLFFLFSEIIFFTPSFHFYGFTFNLDFIISGFIGSGVVSFLSVFMSFLIKKTKQ